MMSNPRTCRILVGALSLTFISFSARAALPNVSPLNTRLNIQISNAPLHQFLETLSAQTKASFILSDDIDDSQRVSEDVKDGEAGEVLQRLLESKGLTYHQVRGTSTYVIVSKASGNLAQAHDAVLKNNRALDAHFKFVLHNTSLKHFLSMITADTGVRFSVAEGAGKNRVTIDFKDVTAREALNAVLEIKNLDIEQKAKNEFVLRPRSKAEQP